MELRVMIEPQQGATYEDQVRFARHAEACGFPGFFRSDHLARIGPGDPGPGPTDVWLTLAGLALETQTIRLGAMLSCATFRLPGLLAVQIAQVDAMSGGRLDVGLGAGWFEPEHMSYGIPFPPPAERRARWEEQLDVLSGIWATPPGSTFDYRGQFYTLVGCPCLPRPVQSPHPPLIVGGKGSRRTPGIAAKYANEYNIAFETVENEAAQFERVRAACRGVDRDPDSLVLSVAVTTAVGENSARTAKRISTIDEDVSRLRAGPGLVGTPDEALERIRIYQAMGVKRMYLQMKDLHDLDQLDLVASSILLPARNIG